MCDDLDGLAGQVYITRRERTSTKGGVEYLIDHARLTRSCSC